MLHLKTLFHIASLAIAVLSASAPVAKGSEDSEQRPLKPTVANDFDVVWQNDQPFIADVEGHLHKTTIDPDLQLKLRGFIAERGSPIASVVVADITTGKVIAMVQGRPPEKWGGTGHTAVHARFPAASLFKTIVTAAAMEMTITHADDNFGLPGGCGGQDILPKGDWINDDRGARMNLRKAFGASCNSFFAKLAVNQLGLGTITHYAKLFGWDIPLSTDFNLEPSRMLPPGVANSTTHTVGRFAAGFGHVTISPAHAAWIALAIGNNGKPKPLQLFSESIDQSQSLDDSAPIVSQDTAARLLDVMKSTVDEGTAHSIFARGRYRSVAQETGGKTGTLRGRTPEGLTTLFLGVYPLSRPQIAVGSVVVLEDHFYFKASQLAAEAIVQWKDLQDQRAGVERSALLEDKPLKTKSKKFRRSRPRRF